MWPCVGIKRPSVVRRAVLASVHSSIFVYSRIWTTVGIWLDITKSADKFEKQQFSFIIGRVMALFRLKIGRIRLVDNSRFILMVSWTSWKTSNFR